MYKLSSTSKCFYWFYLGFILNSILSRIDKGNFSDIGFPIFISVCIILILWLDTLDLCFHYFDTGFGIFFNEWKCTKCQKRIDCPSFSFLAMFYGLLGRVNDIQR